MFQFLLKYQAALSSFWGTEETVKQEGTQISHLKLAGCCSGSIDITAQQCTDTKHTKQAGNRHAEMKSTVDTVGGQEAKSKSST